jgi:hypothetical protein
MVLIVSPIELVPGIKGTKTSKKDLQHSAGTHSDVPPYHCSFCERIINAIMQFD